LDKEFYLPEQDQIKPQSQVNKQGRASEQLSQEEKNRVLEIFNQDSQQAYQHYLELLNLSHDESGAVQSQVVNTERQGIARELARINLSVNYYTQFYWKIDLHNWMHFLKLRADPHAQYEIRVFAEKMLDIFKLWLPLTYQAFENYSLKSKKISAKGMQLIKQLVKGEIVNREESGLSQGEWREIMTELGLATEN
jgi:thymidylate synthase (FAD)